MEKASPYEHPSTAIEEANLAVGFIDPRGTTRFLQIFLIVHACFTTLIVTLPLALSPWQIILPSTRWMFTAAFPAFVGATYIVLILASGAWLWVSQRNQLALGNGAAHHWTLLILAGLGLRNLDAFYDLDRLKPMLLMVAGLALLGTAYVGYFLHRALQADAPRSQGTRMILAFRLWLIATAAAILVPSILVWRSIHFPNAEFDYRHYSRLGFSVFALISELCLVAIVSRLANWQREAYAYMQGNADAETPTPLPIA
jgi:hypothetical protein